MNVYVKLKTLASPLVFSTNCATGEEATHFHEVLAEKLCEKTKSSYVEANTFIRKRISSTIIRTALIALRGKKKNVLRTTPINECDMNIMANALQAAS